MRFYHISFHFGGHQLRFRWQNRVLIQDPFLYNPVLRLHTLLVNVFENFSGNVELMSGILFFVWSRCEENSLNSAHLTYTLSKFDLNYDEKFDFRWPTNIWCQ